MRQIPLDVAVVVRFDVCELRKEGADWLVDLGFTRGSPGHHQISARMTGLFDELASSL